MVRQRVVVTGLGLLTACGQGWEPFWQAVRAGRPAVHPLEGLELDDFPSRFAAQVRGVDLKSLIRLRKSVKVMSRDIQLAVAASELAVRDAGLPADGTGGGERSGVLLGIAAPINHEVEELGAGIRKGFDAEGKFQMRLFGSEGIPALFPLWFLKYVPNMPACHISVTHGFRGPSNTITTSGAAAAQAIGEAFRILERGDANVMIAGGADSEINPVGLSRLHLLGLLSRSKDAARACRPFDRRRDGTVVGEGSGLLVLETLEHARDRGARIYAELLGYGCASDFDTDPRSPEGLRGKRASMERALRDAGIGAQDIDFVAGNGSGLPAQDGLEARALAEVFRDVPEVPVTGFKAIAGHTMYAAGGIEAAAGILSLREGVIPPLAGFEEADEGCRLAFVRRPIKAEKARCFLLNAFGITGQSASLVFGKAGE